MNLICKRNPVSTLKFACLWVIFFILVILPLFPGRILFLSLFKTGKALSPVKTTLLTVITIFCFALAVFFFFFYIVRFFFEKNKKIKKTKAFKTVVFYIFLAQLPFLIFFISIFPPILKTWQESGLTEVIDSGSKMTSAYYLERMNDIQVIQDKYLNALAIERFLRDPSGTWLNIRETDAGVVAYQIYKQDPVSGNLDLLNWGGNSDNFLSEKKTVILEDGVFSSFSTPDVFFEYDLPKDKILCIKTVRVANRQYKCVYTSNFFTGFDDAVYAIRQGRGESILMQKNESVTDILWISICLLLVLPSVLFLPVLVFYSVSAYSNVWETFNQSVTRKTSGSQNFQIISQNMQGEEIPIAEFINRQK